MITGNEPAPVPGKNMNRPLYPEINSMSSVPYAQLEGIHDLWEAAEMAKALVSAAWHYLAVFF